MTQTLLSFSERRLADIVQDDARAAAVLETHGLDFCCAGKRTLDEACLERGVAADAVAGDLAALGAPTDHDRLPPDLADLDRLTRYIIDTHHRYVRDTIPVVSRWLDRLVERHGDRHAELSEVRRLFATLAADMTSHMAKEETLLFPAIDELAREQRVGGQLPAGPFATILHPVRVMEDDHQQAGELLARLREVTHGYDVPPDGCATYRSCYAELTRFEHDLHRHVHLENHVLFPKALEVEQALA